MKKTYKITIKFDGKISMITMTNPPRRFLKVGYKEYSGAEIVKVIRIK